MTWGALSAGLYTLVETAVHRPRPSANLVHVVRHTSNYSFPSGHVIFFSWFFAYLLLAFGPVLPRPARIAGWILAVAWLALVAVGRIDLAEHWPSDVLAGLFLGVAWTALGLAYRPISRGALDG